MNNNKVLGYALVALLSVALIIGVAMAFSSDAAVAKVNGQEISQEELYDLMVKQSGEQALDLLVTQKIVDLEIKKNNVVITQAEIDQQIKELEETYGGEEELKMALEYSGMTMEDLRQNVELNTKIEKLIAPNISITEEEIKEYFEANKESFVTPEQTEPNLENSKDKVKDALFQQKVQAEVNPWLEARQAEYDIVKFL